jgi:hypothetical protein
MRRLSGKLSLAGALLTLRRHRFAGEVAIGLGGFLVLWIVVRAMVVGLTYWVQPTYFIFGLVEIALGFWLRSLLIALPGCLAIQPW